jgi:hypothetical protein
VTATACRELEVMVSLRAAGATDGEDARILDAHLATCERCRRDVASTSVALRLAKIPPPTQTERRAVVDLADRTLAAYERRNERRGIGRRVAVTAAVLAAFVIALVVPFTLTNPEPSPEVAAADVVLPAARGAFLPVGLEPGARVVLPEEWQVPDLEDVWADAGVVSAALAVELGE